jgi:hypothetical protein
MQVQFSLHQVLTILPPEPGSALQTKISSSNQNQLFKPKSALQTKISSANPTADR